MPRAERSDSRGAGDNTRSRILATAAALFAEHGYAGTSVRMVARSLGLTDPAVHYHFPSKHSLYLALLNQPDYGSMPLESEPLSVDSVISQVMHLFRWWVDHPEFGQMLLREQLASEDASLAFMSSSNAAWEMYITRPLSELLGDHGGEASDFIADMLCGLYWECILSYGEKTREIASAPYFEDRLRRMLGLAMPGQRESE